jgi:hypothetical protein
MNAEIRDANLELLIGLKRHLDQAAQLRALLDRLMNLANIQHRGRSEAPVSKADNRRKRRNER